MVVLEGHCRLSVSVRSSETRHATYLGSSKPVCLAGWSWKSQRPRVHGETWQNKAARWLSIWRPCAGPWQWFPMFSSARSSNIARICQDWEFDVTFPCSHGIKCACHIPRMLLCHNFFGQYLSLVSWLRSNSALHMYQHVNIAWDHLCLVCPGNSTCTCFPRGPVQIFLWFVGQLWLHEPLLELLSASKPSCLYGTHGELVCLASCMQLDFALRSSSKWEMYQNQSKQQSINYLSGTGVCASQ